MSCQTEANFVGYLDIAMYKASPMNRSSGEALNQITQHVRGRLHKAKEFDIVSIYLFIYSFFYTVIFLFKHLDCSRFFVAINYWLESGGSSSVKMKQLDGSRLQTNNSNKGTGDGKRDSLSQKKSSIIQLESESMADSTVMLHQQRLSWLLKSLGLAKH